ncbi:hypothetical protein O0L34_g2240 [Tuta absoluta]|nr:hypothetical protein O0L34_g2240 [Tuta absoluta]
MSFRNYYDSSSYGRSRESGRSAASGSTDRPTSVTAKYSSITPSSYKSSSIPVLNSDRTKDDSPISSIANRYASYGKNDKAPTVNKYEKKDYDKATPTSKYEKKDYTDKSNSKYDKKDYDKVISKYDKKDYSDKSSTTSKYDKKDYTSKLTIPSITTSRSRDVSPISTSSKYSLNRPSRHLSPGRVTKSYKDRSRDPSPADREKDIPNKTDKSTSGYNSLSSYKLYPRTSNYSRPSSRVDSKPDLTVNRYSITNRLSSNYLRSPPSVSRTSVSPVNHTDLNRDSKSDKEKSVSPIVSSSPITTMKETNEPQTETNKNINENGTGTIVGEGDVNETETIIVITRHTSPTPPGSSAYVRSRRAELAKTIEKTLTRPKLRPQMFDKEIQSDRLDDPTRCSRFGSTTRASTTGWSYYTPCTGSYTGYAGRYSTQYIPTAKDSGTSQSYSHSDRSSRSLSTERLSKDSISPHTHSENSREIEKPLTPVLNNIPESTKEIVPNYERQTDDDTSEIIINVNLKLKKANTPLVTASAELVSPEITITNSQLPPQPPKPEGTANKTKKIKARKSSVDSSSDSGSKKKVIRRKSKSGSSTDSDQGSDANEKGKDSSAQPNSVTKISSRSNQQNGHAKLKHSKSRESNSPESVSTLSTQSSVSEDDSASKSKTNDARTSADEVSIPTDRSAKQSSPMKNEGTEEAKSFLIRALAPVTNLFKMRHQDSSENKSTWPPENSTSESTGKDVSNLVTESEKSGKSKTSNIIASNDDNLVKLKAIRHIESGERAWWLDSPSDNNIQSAETKSPSDKNIPKKIRHIESGERAWWLETNSSENKNDASQTQSDSAQQTNSGILMNSTESTDPNRPFKKCKFADEEKPWWLDSSANIPEGVERLTPPRKSSSESEKSEKYNFFKVRHIESGEQKDWWLTSNENSTNSKSQSATHNNVTQSQSGSEQRYPIRRIRHVESGERPWWLSSNQNIPEGIEKLPPSQPQPDSDSSDSEEVQVYVPPGQIPPFPINLPDDEPLGARRSPEGLETPKENEDYRDRASPYENSRQYNRRRGSNVYQKGAEKYISRYTDIDDILGTGGQIYSPFMDSILARRTGQMQYDDDECEEIDPTQVRIHDSTAQMPVIMKLRGRGEVVDYHDEDQVSR